MADTQNKPEKPLHALLSHQLVDIYVGPENTHWILHEKLLCARSKFFQKIFYSKQSATSSYGLPDDEDDAFAAFVAWLYGGAVRPPKEEKDLSILFELYLMSEKWAVPALQRDVLAEVREWYARTDTYPGLRRVQYIYANTDEASEMRRLLVHSVARMMALSDSIPQHWDKALRKNGQLAVDLIKSIQMWHIDAQSVPDPRRGPESTIQQEKKQAEEALKVEKEAEQQEEDQRGAGKKDGEEKAQANGVNGHNEEEGESDDSANKEQKDDEDQNKTNGLTNGVQHDDDDDDDDENDNNDGEENDEEEEDDE